MDQETNSVRLEKLKDQFGDNTRKTRRNLVILCAITLVLSLGDLKLENLFGINLADQASRNFAIGAFYIMVLFEFISFIFYGYLDHKAWSLNSKAKLLLIEHKYLEKISSSTESISFQLGYIRSKMRPEDISPIEAIKSQSGVMDNVVTTASEQLESFKLAIANFQRELKQNNTVHMVKLYFLDWGVPLFLSMLVFIRNYKAFIHFFTALFTKN